MFRLILLYLSGMSVTILEYLTIHTIGNKEADTWSNKVSLWYLIGTPERCIIVEAIPTSCLLILPGTSVRRFQSKQIHQFMLCCNSSLPRVTDAEKIPIPSFCPFSYLQPHDLILWSGFKITILSFWPHNHRLYQMLGSACQMIYFPSLVNAFVADAVWLSIK